MHHAFRLHAESAGTALAGIVIATSTSGTALQWGGLILGYLMFGLGVARVVVAWKRPGSKL